jgi:leukotriene-A4 hydrolase
VFPCQDTPDVKSTFEFNITSPLHVIASGILVSATASSAAEEAAGQKVYKFKQDVPIPSYLWALASGLVIQRISRRDQRLITAVILLKLPLVLAA